MEGQQDNYGGHCLDEGSACAARREIARIPRGVLLLALVTWAAMLAKLVK